MERIELDEVTMILQHRIWKPVPRGYRVMEHHLFHRVYRRLVLRDVFKASGV